MRYMHGKCLTWVNSRPLSFPALPSMSDCGSTIPYQPQKRIISLNYIWDMWIFWGIVMTLHHEHFQNRLIRKDTTLYFTRLLQKSKDNEQQWAKTSLGSRVYRYLEANEKNMNEAGLNPGLKKSINFQNLLLGTKEFLSCIWENLKYIFCHLGWFWGSSGWVTVYLLIMPLFMACWLSLRETGYKHTCSL